MDTTAAQERAGGASLTIDSTQEASCPMPCGFPADLLLAKEPFRGQLGLFSKKKYWLYPGLGTEQCSKVETNLGYLRAKKEKRKKRKEKWFVTLVSSSFWGRLQDCAGSYLHEGVAQRQTMPCPSKASQINTTQMIKP